MTRFLRDIESLRLAEHEAQLRATPPRALAATPHEPRQLAHLPPTPATESISQGKRTPASTRVAILKASQVEGVTHRELAERFGCSETHVGRVLRKAGAPPSKFARRRTT